MTVLNRRIETKYFLWGQDFNELEDRAVFNLNSIECNTSNFSPFSPAPICQRRELPEVRKTLNPHMVLTIGRGGDLGGWGDGPPKFEVGTAHAFVPPNI